MQLKESTEDGEKGEINLLKHILKQSKLLLFIL